MVAVLMTDLVGSTAMADRVGPEAAEELRTEHFGLLRGALERTSRREVKNLGDGLMVVFSSAPPQRLGTHRHRRPVEMALFILGGGRRARAGIPARARQPRSSTYHSLPQ